MIEKIKSVREKLNNYYLICFFVTLSIVCTFYPISSGASILGYFALFYVVENYKDLPTNKIFKLVCIFSIWLLFCCFITYFDYKNTGSEFWSKELRYFFMFLMLTIMIKKISFEKILKVYLGVGAVFILLGYVEVLCNNKLDWFFRIFRSHAKDLHFYFDDNIPRLLSISRNADPNFVGFIIAVLFITITVYLLYGLLTEQKLRLKYCIYCLFTAIALLLTGSRGGTLIALFALIILCLVIAKIINAKIVYKTLFIMLLLGVAFLIILGYFFPDNIFISKLLVLFKEDTWQRGTSEGMRFEMISLSFQILKENFLFGVGPTGFQVSSHLPEYYIKSLATHNFRDPHNFLLTVGMLAGVPGIILIITILVSNILNIIKCLKEMLTLERLVILAWTLCFIATIPFEFPLQDESRLVLLNLYFAMACVYYDKEGISNER